MNKKSLLIISLAMAVSITACKHKHEEKEAEGKYTATSPIVMDTTITKDYIAQIQSIQNIELRAQEKGFLQEIYVDEGKYVHKGQALFKIMPKFYEAEVLKAKADIAIANAGILKAKAEITSAETELANTKSLASKQIVSKSEQVMAQAKVESAKSEYNAKLSELEGAKAALTLAELHLSLTVIKAPFDGILNRIPKKLGSLIGEGELLTTLSNNQQVFAYFNVSEVEYLDFKNKKTDDKQTVSLILANGDEHKQKGVIETIEGEFDNETGNIAFRAKFPNSEALLKHGETGKVRLTIPLKNALIIPQKCTYELQDKIFVYVIDKEHKLRARNIVVKQKISNLYVIESGLSTDDKILLDGLQSAKEDEKIESTFIDAKTAISQLQLIKK